MLAQVNNKDIVLCALAHNGRYANSFAGGVFAPMQETPILQYQKLNACALLRSGGASAGLLPDLPIEDIHHPTDSGP